MELEKRTYVYTPELRAHDGGVTVRGYAAIFNSEAEIGGSFREVVRPGAFSKTLSGDIRALVNHDAGRVIGRTKAGTLRLNEDARGLAVEIDLPDTSDGRDLAELVRRGDIDGMSFGFRATSEVWTITDDDELDLREITETELFEVSSVTWPAYSDTSLAMRSHDRAMEKAEKERREAEKARDLYFVRKAEAEQRLRGIRR